MEREKITETNLKKCKWCGKEYHKTHNRQEYCGNHCKKQATREKTRIRVDNHREKNRERYNELVVDRMERHRKRWRILKEYQYQAIGKAYEEHGKLMNQYHIGKGTSSLGPTPHQDPETEAQVIQRELKRLKIKRISKALVTPIYSKGIAKNFQKEEGNKNAKSRIQMP